jgi:hypothetical protein
MCKESANRKQDAPTLGRGVPSFCLLPLSVAVFLAGCHSEGTKTLTNTDPLLGPVTVQPAGSTGGAVPPGGAAPSGSVPPLPAQGSITSNAALAPGMNQTLDPSRDLRIQGAPPGTGATNGGWRGPSDVTLSQPETAGSLAARTEVRPLPAVPLAPVSPPVTARGVSAEASLLSQVTARGAKFQMLQTWGDAGEWKFSCSIPNRQNPNIRRTYEARAGDPVSAIQAVLDQIDREQH